MENIYMVQVERIYEERVLETSIHGAFKSFRSASQWLIEEGYEAFYSDELSELFEEETIQFTLDDKKNEETCLAIIETYKIQD